MKVKIKKASNILFSETREVSTLEELLAIDVEFGENSIVVSHDPRSKEVYVTIYDDYLE